MAENHGGYRRPSDPAAVSGPGSLSQRTDGGPTQAPMMATGGEYGERAEMESIQQGAALAGGGPSRADLPSLDAPTANPGEPVTAGADAGLGPDSIAAGIRSDSEITNEQFRPLVKSLELIANMPSSNPEFRSFVRNVKARLSNG